MVIGKCTDVFRGIFLVLGVGLGEGAVWEDLSLEKYVMGEEKFNEKGAERRTNLVPLEKTSNSELNIQCWVFGAFLLWSII